MLTSPGLLAPAKEAGTPPLVDPEASDFDLRIEVVMSAPQAVHGKGKQHPDTLSYFSLCPSCGGSCTFCPTCPFTCGSCAVTCPWCRTGPYCVSVSNCCWTLNGC